MSHLEVTIRGQDGGTRMGFYTVVFAEGLVKVELRAADSDVHAAVVESRHRIGRKRYVVWQRDSGNIR